MVEELEFIDEKEKTLGRASLEEIHQKGLLHKSVHVLVFDREGKLYCRYRSPERSVNPGWTCLGAHVLPGEDYDASAVKALDRVLGLTCRITKIGKIRVKSKAENEISETYVCHLGDNSQITDPTVEKAAFFTAEEIKQLANKKQTTPHLIKSLELYLKSETKPQ